MKIVFTQLAAGFIDYKPSKFKSVVNRRGHFDFLMAVEVVKFFSEILKFLLVLFLLFFGNRPAPGISRIFFRLGDPRWNNQLQARLDEVWILNPVPVGLIYQSPKIGTAKMGRNFHQMIS